MPTTAASHAAARKQQLSQDKNIRKLRYEVSIEPFSLISDAAKTWADIMSVTNEVITLGGNTNQNIIPTQL